MRGSTRMTALLLGLLAGPALAQTTVLTAARIHTMDTAQPLAQAMAYDASGKILAVGSTGELQARYPQARRLDVGSATVVPGLIDAHAHVGGLGFAMMSADLVGTASKAEVLTASGATGKGVDAVLFRVLQILDEAKAEQAEAVRRAADPHWAP